MILNNSTQKYLILFGCIMFLVNLSSCTRDKVEKITSTCVATITYDQHIQLLLDNNCNASGCHNSNSSNGDFTSYDRISKYFNGTKLYQRVINLKNMPSNAELTTENLELFNCWIEGGYLEN